MLPEATRQRLGFHAGAHLTITEELDGLKLRLAREVAHSDLSALAGLVKAPPRRSAGRLDDSDPATTPLASAQQSTPQADCRSAAKGKADL